MRVITSAGAADLAVRGDLTRNEARELYETFLDLAHRRDLRHVRVDLSRVGGVDSAGAVALSLGETMLADSGKTCELVELRGDLAAAVRQLRERPRLPPAREPPSFFEHVGGIVLRTRDAIWELVDFGWEAMRSMFAGVFGRARLRGAAVLEQAVVIGVDAVYIVSALAMLVGITLALQSALQLRQFGAEIYLAELVSLGMVREFGPLVTGILLAGRSGAAMAAELGTMSVNEETDALRAMGIDPIGYLVLPRVAAISLMQPLLSLLAMACGIAGGLAIAHVVQVPAGAVFTRMQEALFFPDFVLGLIKSLLFAWIIGLTSCFVGLRTRGGAHGVGRSTTRAVVASIVLIIVFDSAVTTLWTLAYGD